MLIFVDFFHPVLLSLSVCGLFTAVTFMKKFISGDGVGDGIGVSIHNSIVHWSLVIYSLNTISK